jgi:tetratricopeptide (TPR) repeat protein
MNDFEQPEPTETTGFSAPEQSLADCIRRPKSAGDFDGVLAIYREQEHGIRESNNLAELKENLKDQGDLLREKGDWSGAMRIYLEAERICREIGDSRRLQAVLNNQGLSLEELGDLEQAERQFQESERICRELQDWTGVCRCLFNRARLLNDRGDLNGALGLYQELECIYRKVENVDELAASLGSLARIFKKLKNVDKALALYKEQGELFREKCNPSGLRDCLGKQADILKAQNNLPAALPLYKEQEQLCRQLTDRAGLLWCLGSQFYILANLKDHGGALALCSEQEQLCEELKLPDILRLCLRNHAITLQELNEETDALTLYRKEEQLCRELADQDALQICLGDQALILKRIRDIDGAPDLLKKKTEICRTLEKPAGVRWSLRQQALILEEGNHLNDALRLLKEEEDICRQLDKPTLLMANLDCQSRIYRIQRERSDPLEENHDSGISDSPVANVATVTYPNQTSQKSLTDRVRPLWVASLYILALLITIPSTIALLSLLVALLTLVVGWFLVDRLWRTWRWTWRKLTAKHILHIADRLTHAVLTGSMDLSDASIHFSRCSLRLVKAGVILRSLVKRADTLRTASQESVAVVWYRFALALADMRGSIEDRKKCRQILVACLSANTIDSNIRDECESLLERDRGPSPQLFAASQIARAKALGKLTTEAKCSQKIETLTPVESSLEPADDLVQWIETKNLLSLTHWMRWQLSKDPADLEKAITYSLECLEVLKEDDRPADWASAHYNLGVFYSVRTSAQPQHDIELTIESMECALRVLNPGEPAYVDAQKRLMAALSRRSNGIESLNLDRGVDCINAAFADPTLTEVQRTGLDKSLKVLLHRRWGNAVSSLADEKHADATQQFFDTPLEVPTSELRRIVGSGEPFDRRRRILARLWWSSNLLGMGCIYKFWHEPWILTGSLSLITTTCLVTYAFVATEGVEKVIRLPLDFLRTIPPFGWWLMTSKDPHKMRMIRQVVSFISNPELAVRTLEEIWRGINRERNRTVWALVGSIYAWLSLQFPRGETGESVQNAVTILQEAGDIFTKKRFGAFQTGIDLSLAKAYLLLAETGRVEAIEDAVHLITDHLLPVRLIGSRKNSGILWGQALQLLGDAYMKLASNGKSQFLNEAIRCYVESLGERPVLNRRFTRAPAALASIARMRPTSAMRAHALKGIGSALIRLPDGKEVNRHSLAITCLVNAYDNFNAPRYVGQLAALVSPKEKPVLSLESLQAAESKLEVFILTARALTLTTSDSEPQYALAEAILRVCASNALHTGCNEIAYSAFMDLGELLSRQEHHEEAVAVYDLAIRHVEASRAVAHLIERRAEIARYHTEPFDRIVVSLARLGRLGDALGYVERGKSLGISDLVSLGTALRNPSRAPELSEYSTLQIKAAQLSQEITRRSQLSGTGGRTAGAWNRRYITPHRQEFYRTTERLLELTESVSSSNITPALKVKTLGASGIRQFGRDTKAAFVFFRVTDEATHAFVVTPGKVRAVRSDQLKISDLDQALGLSASSLPRKWWFTTDDPESFRVELNRLLNRLGDAVMRKITAVLREQQLIEGV